MKLRFGWMTLVMLLLAVPWAYAQEAASVSVPDLTGLNVPQAAVTLNEAGLALGTETALGWTAESGLPENTISQQTPAAGEQIEAGSAVNVTVLRSNNAILIYDDNDITLVNNTGGPLNLNGLTFSAVGGTTAASFNAGRWSPTLQSGDCGQLWSVARTGPKDVAECLSSTLWLTTNDSGQHFWTGSNGATQFNVVQDGVERAVCPVTVTGRCEFYLATNATTEVTPYVYFAYTSTQLIIMNQSDDQWMSIAELRITDSSGLTSPIATPEVYDAATYATSGLEIETFRSPVARVGQLAPGQCLFLMISLPAETPPPQPCTVIGQITAQVEAIWWQSPFRFVSLTDGVSRGCPGATPERLTVCILPR